MFLRSKQKRHCQARSANVLQLFSGTCIITLQLNGGFEILETEHFG